AEMSLVHSREVSIAWMDEARSNAARDAWKMALDKALSLDPDLAIAHSRLAGWYQGGEHWDFAAAEREAEHALKLAPRDPIVLGNAALLYTTVGRFDEGIAIWRDVSRIDPLNVLYLTNLAFSYWYAGRWAETESTLRKALQLNPAQNAVRGALAHVLHEQGRSDEALREIETEVDPEYRLRFKSEILADLGRRQEAEAALEEYVKAFPPDYARYQRAMVYIKLGLGAEADSALAQVIEHDSEEYPTSVADLYATKGAADEAFRWLDRAAQQRDSYVTLSWKNIYLLPLRSDPRWKAILKKAGFPI
ncbi:MAG: tetratricopeptide repeat protein, partial [Rubricoccaceae bacterium]|nr:tetratricopeptide repeat protein [Rubricoccaceae bacterium]